MIPILYESTETAFTSNGLGRLRDCISCVVSEERNSIYECDFEYPVTGVHYEDIRCGRIIAVTHDNTGDVQPFDIISRTNPINGRVTFHAVHISYRTNKMTVRATNINSVGGAMAVLSGSTPASNFSFKADFDATGYLALADGLPHSVRQMLGGTEGSILYTYGGEYKWDKWNVRLMASRGSDKDYTIRYGVNLTDYNEDIDYSGSYSQVVPYWTDGSKKVIGDVCTYSTTTYNNREECIPLDLSDMFQSKPTKTALETVAHALIARFQPTLPEQTIKVEFVRLADSPEYSTLSNLQNFELCDTVKAVFPMYNLSGKFKIVKTVYDVLLERFNSMELGTLAATLSEALGITTNQGANSSSTATIKLDHGTTASYVTIGSSGVTAVDVPVTFNATFDSIPDVVGVLRDVQNDSGSSTNIHQLSLQLKSVTTTTATFNIKNNGSATRKALISWVAISN